MTLNEKIALKMGWEKTLGSPYAILITQDPSPKDMLFVAKLLQQKMVDEGWHIVINNWSECSTDFPHKIYFSIETFNYDIGLRKTFADADTEPAAIVALFAKVFNLEEK